MTYAIIQAHLSVFDTMDKPTPGRLIVVSGPSGSGKTTLVHRAVDASQGRVRLSTSATTRAPRPGEVHGREYVFYTRAEFETARDEGRLLEWADVHGNLYGTPAEPVRQTLESGICVLLEIDVQGAFQVIDRFPEAILIFIRTADYAILEDRLRGRSTEDEATILRRLDNARRELALADRYHHQLINEDLDQAVLALSGLLSRLGCGG